MSTKRLAAGVGSMLAVFALVACGSSAKTTSGTTTTAGTTTTTSAAAGSATTAAGTDTTAAGTQTTAATAPVNTNFSGSGSGSVCAYAQDISNQSSGLSKQLSTPGADLKTTFSKIQGIVSTAIAKAPSEIKADLQTLSDYIKQIDSFYAKYNYDSAKLIAAVQKDPTVANQFTSIASNANLQAASKRVTAYFDNVCHIKSTTSST